MEIDQINDIKLSPQLLNYFQCFNDFQYSYIHSMIENIKKVYKVSSLEVISQILYLHKISFFLKSYIDEVSSTNSAEKLLEIISDLVSRRYSSIILKNDRISEVNSMIYFYQNCKNFSQTTFDLSLSNFTIHLSEIQTHENNISINKKLFETGLKTLGRLDIYIKSIIFKQIINIHLNSLEKVLPKEFLSSLNTMEKDINRILSAAESQAMNEEKYSKLLNIFVDDNTMKREQIKDLRKLFIVYQNVNDEVSLKFCEKLFIQMLGHREKEIRDEAVKLLNMFYDETNWQEKESFKEISISNIGEEFSLELVVRKNDFDQDNTMVIISSPSYNLKVPLNVISWNSISSTEIIQYKNEYYVRILISNLDFTRCGYYDWNLVKYSKKLYRFSEGRFSTLKRVYNLNNPKELINGIGRIIVIEKSISDQNIHEVFTDLLDAEIDKDKGKIKKRGDFKTLENKLEEFSQRYINCLYIMGALERDNLIYIDDKTEEIIDIGNMDCSPMAIICRSTISRLLGGDKAFKSLIDKAKKFSIKIIIDSLARISSSRHHRRYNKILLNFLDDKGKKNLCFGTDGISTSYEDTALLNYRKVESWDMLVNDLLIIALKYEINGVHLDNCQAWPQIMKINYDEMTRLDSDLKPAYTLQQIIDGEIVYRDEDCGYWDSEVSIEYPNPMLLKLTKKLWKFCPKFIFIGECWMTSKFVNRHINLAKSGIIPRLYTLPRTLSNVFGRRIHKSGHIEIVPPSDVSVFKEWIEENNKNVPNGTVFIQSSCGLVWPYPSLLYGRGNWASVDLLFTLPDIPMTFMGEIEGESYRLQITNLYINREIPKSTHLVKKSKSHISLDYEEEENFFEIKNTSSDKIGKVRSLVNVSAVTLNDVKNIKEKQDHIIREIGPEFGFDLRKIKFHYDSRMKMRRKHECLRRGKLLYLNTFDSQNKPHPNVFTFARYTPEETGIIIINFKNHVSNFKLDLKNLLSIFSKSAQNFNTMCYVEDWVLDEKGDYYFLSEIISEGYIKSLNPFTSIIFGVKLIETTEENFKFTLDKSMSRMISLIKCNEYSDSCRLTIQLKYILQNLFELKEFALWYNSALEILTKYNISMFSYIKQIKYIKDDSSLATTFFQYCYQILVLDNKFEIQESIQSTIKSNELGSIVFVTPELGRWSTIGGLGVMVDELSQGLNKVGQDVIMITPLYERNRKGETGYLEKDPAGFKHIGNIDIYLDKKANFGIHYGIVNGVKIYFLHNFEIFPSPYSEGCPSYILRQISYFSKAALECLCFLKIIPALILTNDWFTGLVAAYSKHGHFGDTFKGTTFFHIAHNLETNYEGRLFPETNEGTLDHIHKLPSHLLVDPFWEKKFINPSRCAIMSSDHWGTVSPSYRSELLETSPLNSLLRNFREPFAFPNGIFRSQRLKNLEDKVGLNHLSAKAILQKKYFKFLTVDHTIPVFAFVGRITEQKGVILILNSAEAIINKYNGKVNILVGGMGNPKDPYCMNCINKMNYLREKYPYNFWANPYEFFTDGPAVNVGADFGLMPSLFEPGGIVQHEFFIGGTPVLAFKTGGLKDTVFEFNYQTNKGNGITFESHNIYDLMWGYERAINLFKNKEKYEMCRKNAFSSAIDVIDVAKAWKKEFFRLRNKIFYNQEEINSNNFPINPKNVTNNNIEIKKEILKFEISNSLDMEKKPTIEDRVPITFYYVSDKSKASSVQICGSFDKWQVRHPLIYDPLKDKWSVTLKIKKGTYYYKYIVDTDWLISSIEKTSTDNEGNINNIILV